MRAVGDLPTTADPATIRVLLVEDHRVVREGTRELLEHEDDIRVVGEADSAEDALRLTAALDPPPQLALVDVALPGMNGVDLVRVLHEQAPGVRALVLSAYDDYVFVTEALAAGAAGFLLKTVSAGELVSAVRSAVAGATVMDQTISRRMVERWQRTDRAVPVDLTAREADVVRLLAKGRSNKEIAAELGVGLRTVESYVSNVLTKFGVRSRTEAVVHAIGHGLAAVDTPPRGT